MPDAGGVHNGFAMENLGGNPARGSNVCAALSNCRMRGVCGRVPVADRHSTMRSGLRHGFFVVVGWNQESISGRQVLGLTVHGNDAVGSQIIVAGDDLKRVTSLHMMDAPRLPVRRGYGFNGSLRYVASAFGNVNLKAIRRHGIQ